MDGEKYQKCTIVAQTSKTLQLRQDDCSIEFPERVTGYVTIMSVIIVIIGSIILVINVAPTMFGPEPIEVPLFGFFIMIAGLGCVAVGFPVSYLWHKFATTIVEFNQGTRAVAIRGYRKHWREGDEKNKGKEWLFTLDDKKSISTETYDKSPVKHRFVLNMKGASKTFKVFMFSEIEVLVDLKRNVEAFLEKI